MDSKVNSIINNGNDKVFERNTMESETRLYNGAIKDELSHYRYRYTSNPIPSTQEETQELISSYSIDDANISISDENIDGNGILPLSAVGTIRSSVINISNTLLGTGMMAMVKMSILFYYFSIRYPIIVIFFYFIHYIYSTFSFLFLYLGQT